MHLSMETNNNGDTPGNHVADDPPIIDFSLPITTTYLNHMKSKKGFLDENYVYHADGEVGTEFLLTTFLFERLATS